MISERPFAAVARLCVPLLAACASFEPGIDVELRAEAPPAPFIDERGYEVELLRAWVAVGEARLGACGPQLGLASLLPVRTARAHGDHGAVGAGVHVDLLDPDGARLAGLAAAPGSYCKLALVLRPGGEVPGADVELAGRTVHLEGRWRHPEAGSGTFTVSLDGTLEAPVALGRSLALEQRGDHVVELELAAAGWLRGVDFAHTSARERAAAVRANLVGGFGLVR